MAAIEDKPDATVGRMLERLNKIENLLAGLGDTAELHKRIENLENSQYTNKDVLTFDEACKYLGVSDSLLYKLTAAKAVPHYKPRGKNDLFQKTGAERMAPAQPGHHRGTSQTGGGLLYLHTTNPKEKELWKTK